MQAVAALRGGFGGHQVMSVAEGEKLRADGAPKHEKAVAAKVAAQGEADQERGQGRGQGSQGRGRRPVVGHRLHRGARKRAAKKSS